MTAPAGVSKVTPSVETFTCGTLKKYPMVPPVRLRKVPPATLTEGTLSASANSASISITPPFMTRMSLVPSANARSCAA